MKRPLFLLLLPVLAHAGQLELPSTGPGRMYSRSPLWISNGQGARVVIGTENPFGPEEKDRSLYVRNDAGHEAQFRLRARLWNGAEPTPLKGAVEVPLQLVAGALQVHVATSTEPLTAQPTSVRVTPEQVQARISLEVGQLPQLHLRGKSEKGVIPTEAGRVVIRFEWDYTPGQPPTFALTLNGEPLGSREPAEAMVALGGVNTLTIMALQGAAPAEFFIGPIQAME